MVGKRQFKRGHARNYVKTWSIAPTAGNVSKELTAGTGYKIKMMYGKITLTTDATVANRYLVVAVETTGDVEISAGMASIAVPASSTVNKPFTNKPVHGDTSDIQVNALVNKNGIHPFYQDVIYETDKFTIDITSGQAGDSYTGIFKYLKVEIDKEFPE